MPFFDVQNGQTTGDQSLWNQFADAFTGAQDADVQLFSQISPPSAPTVSVNTTAGNLTGNYQYALAFETGYWQGPVGSGTLHVANNTGGGAASTTISPNGQQATVNIPSAPTGVVNVLVYRTKANGSTFYYLTTVQANTSTQITDNALDSALGAQMPTTNTTGGHFIGDGSKLTNLPIPANTASTTSTQTWTASQTYDANNTYAPTGTATSSNNYGSNQLQFSRSTWSGSAATTDTSYLYKDANGVFHYVNGSGTSIWQVDNSGNVSANSFTSNGNAVLTTASNYVSSVNGQTGAVTVQGYNPLTSPYGRLHR